MKISKGMICFLFAMLIVLALSACGGKEKASTDPNAGLYTASTVEMMGFEIDAGDAFESGFTIELKDGGKCSLAVDGKKANGKWTLNGTTFHVEGGGLKCDGTLENGVMELIDVMGMNVTLLTETATAPAKAKASTPAASGNSGNSLVGVWEEIDIDNIYTFNADGTGSEYYDGNTWDMEWTLDGNILTMDFFDAGIEEYEIILDGDTLIVTDASEDIEYEYKRQ